MPTARRSRPYLAGLRLLLLQVDSRFRGNDVWEGLGVIKARTRSGSNGIGITRILSPRASPFPRAFGPLPARAVRRAGLRYLRRGACRGRGALPVPDILGRFEPLPRRSGGLR